MKAYRVFAALYAAALTAFTGYLALDTFVLSESYQENTGEIDLSMFENTDAPEIADSAAETVTESSAEDSHTARSARGGRHSQYSYSYNRTDTETEAVQPETASDGAALGSYQDENISVTLTEYEVSGTAVYVADVQLSSAQYLKSAFANDTYGKNVTAATSSIAAAHDAVLAVNGDYYGVQESGYVIRNGKVYRSVSSGEDLLCLYTDGSMQIVNSDEMTAEALVENGVWQAWCFGPALTEAGAVTVSQGEEVGRAMASNPRTAIGMIEPLHYLFVVSDGRTAESEGLSLYELAVFMQSLGAEVSYNLDGGGSSTMYFQGEVVNHPTTNGSTIKERGVSDIVYIG